MVDLSPSCSLAVKVLTLVDRARTVLEKSNRDQVFIAVAGGPGSGKSTLAELVRDKLNASNESADHEISVVLPMDGYHYPKAELKRMGEANDEYTYEMMMLRRGAPFTYDHERLIADLKTAKASGEGSFPTYSREISDPVSGGVQLMKSHQIVLCEGLYLLAQDDPNWEALGEIWDDRWYLNTPENIVKARLVKRHLQNWNSVKVRNWGEGCAGAVRKTEQSDLLNTRWIDKTSRDHCDICFQSFET
jgi:pantothenate kinase